MKFNRRVMIPQEMADVRPIKLVFFVAGRMEMREETIYVTSTTTPADIISHLGGGAGLSLSDINGVPLHADPTSMASPATLNGHHTLHVKFR